MVPVDDRSRYTWAYFLENKSDSLGSFKDWMVKVERFTARKVKVVRSDNGGEYTSKEFEDHLRLLGIEHQTTVIVSFRGRWPGTTTSLVKSESDLRSKAVNQINMRTVSGGPVTICPPQSPGDQFSMCDRVCADGVRSHARSRPCA